MAFRQMKSSQNARIDLTPLPYGSAQDVNLTQTQTSEILTQNHDLTELGDDDGAILSPLPPFSPRIQRTLPWGRLMPTASKRHAFDLLPRQPDHLQTTGGVSFLGMDHIHPSDLFNEHTVGRSPKCDLRAIKPDDGPDTDENNRQQWAYGVISNRHCRIYCCLDSQMTEPGISVPRMQVYLEDSSGNGTIVNQTTILRKGEKRVLHTGDEICLVNPHTLKKKIRSATVLKELLSQHSFVFVNLHQQQPGFTAQVLKSWQMNPPSTVGKNRKSAVNVREIRQHANYVCKSPAVDLVGWRALQNRQFANRLPVPNTSRRVDEEYDIRDLLGSGTVGEVRRAIHRKSGEERAVKIISIGGRNRGLMQVQPTQSLQAEANILRKLKHPYVVQLFDVYPPTVSSSNLYLVMELLHGGDLFDRIVDKGKFSETESRRLMRRLLNAIHYLHEDCNIVHRDLKPENILCVHKGQDRCVEIKITDFGLAKAVNGCQDSLKTFCGTPQYFAPEVLKRRSTVAGRGRYGKPADMWSLGVILYVLLSGTQPFNADLDDAVSLYSQSDDDDLVVQFPIENWRGVSEAARDLIRKLLIVDTNRRCSVGQACDHEWMLVDDGDTHVHPLDDPLVKEFRKNNPSTENEVDLMRRLSVEDSCKDIHDCHLHSNLAVTSESQSIAVEQITAYGAMDETDPNRRCQINLAAEVNIGSVSDMEPVSPRNREVVHMDGVSMQEDEAEPVCESPSAPPELEVHEKDSSKRENVFHGSHADAGGPLSTERHKEPKSKEHSILAQNSRNLYAFCTPNKESRGFLKKKVESMESSHHLLTRCPLSPNPENDGCWKQGEQSPSESNTLDSPKKRESFVSYHTTPFASFSTPPTTNCKPARVSDFPNDRAIKAVSEEDDLISFSSGKEESISSFSSISLGNSKSCPHEMREQSEKTSKKRKTIVANAAVNSASGKSDDEPAVNKRIKTKQHESHRASAKRQMTLSSWFTKSADEVNAGRMLHMSDTGSERSFR